MADSPDAALPRILFVVSTKTGGMPQTNLDLMHSLRGRYHGLLLRSDAEVVTLSELVGDELVVRETHPLSEPIDPVTHRSDEYDHLVLDLMYRYSVALLHIRHVAWHSLGIAEAAKFLGIPVVYSSHDFYAVCPSLNLLDEDIRYCAGHCTPGDGTCLVVLWPPSRLPSLKHRFVHRWRDMFHELFAACDALVLSTQSAADILLGFFPEAREKTSIIAHGRDFRELRSAVRHPTPDGTIRVIVPGNISPSKGAHLLRAIHEVDEDKRLEFHFLGNVIGSLGTFGARHGTYDRAQFASKVDAIGPHVGVILSVCPETYCHTLTELWASGVPVVAIDLGAVGERIRKTGGGWLVPPDASPTEVRDAIIAAVDDAESFDQRLREVRAWQLSEGRWNTTARMSVEYRRLYGRLLSHAAPDAPPIPRIGLVLKGRRSRPATAYIRLLQPLAVEIDGRFMDVRITTQAWLDAGGVDHVDALVIQRDAVEASQTTHLIDRLASRAIPYAYEVDDKLWAMPEDHWDHGIDPDQQEAIRQLIQRAAVVTTSTEALATELREWNGNVRVVSNDLDPSIWLAPIPSDYAARVIEECELQDDVPRILYMGTRCHGPDLDMVAPAVEEVTRALRHVKVIQIRGGNLLPTARKIPVPDEHAEYPDFVRWFRVLCSRATIAIAPLRATEFNEVKSDIKVLDYALGKVPAIFSAVAPYRAAVSHRETGLLCENDTSAWRDAMVTLLHDEALRTTLRDGAFDRATRRLLGRTGKHPWREVLAELVASRVRADSKR